MAEENKKRLTIQSIMLFLGGFVIIVALTFLLETNLDLKGIGGILAIVLGWGLISFFGLTKI